MNNDSYVYLQNKRWRSLTYNWELLSANGDTARLYCLTDFQVAWLLSNTEYMRWATRWVDCPCTQNDLEAMKAELDYNLMNCLNVQPWQMSYIYDQQVNDNIAILNGLYDAGGIPDVNPETPTDYYSGDDSVDRLNALCTACKIYVYSYAQNWLAKASLGLGIAVLVGLAASITIVGGIIASVLVGGLAYITSIAMDAMQDKPALDDVVCCMYNNLNGLDITSANFETALDGCSFTVGSNQAIIRDIIASDLDQFGNWLSFIDQLGNSYVLAQIGVIDCPCPDAPWSSSWLGGNGNPVSDGWVLNYGTYDSGDDDITGVTVATTKYIEIIYTFSFTTTLTSIQWDGFIKTSVPGEQLIRIFNASSGIVVDVSPNVNHATLTANGLSWSGNQEVHAGWFIGIGSNAPTVAGGASTEINNIVVSGEGVNPFA